jgi:RNA polymerase sigma-70 factor, ECF subfamily
LEPGTQILVANIRKAKEGNESARADLYKQFSQQMFSICVRITGNYADAKDILQDSFVAAFDRLHQLKELHLFGPWLRKIVVNECIRHTKKSFLWQPVDEEIIGFAEDDTIDWLKQISFEQIHEEIKNLPNGCRGIFNLYVVEDFSHQAIADALGISISTSKSQYQRARQLLKERLLKQLIQHARI